MQEIRLHQINNPLAGMIQTAEVITRHLIESSNVAVYQGAAEELETTMEIIEQFMEIRGILQMISDIGV